MKTGFIAMVGLPNAGKSTLVNSLIGEKVGIVSKKPQTTRRRVIGVYNDNESQICFIDAPGRVRSTTGLNQFLEKELEGVIRESDACLAVLNLDAHNSTDLLEIVELTKKANRPWAIFINKTDMDIAMSGGMREMKLRHDLIPLIKDLDIPIFAGSVINNPEKIERILLPILKGLLPDTQAVLYEKDIYTTQTSRDLVAEIVREKCFEYLHQEIPYGIAVQVMKYDETGSTHKIYVDIVVAKESFVSIVLGLGGSMIKRIGTSARIECEKIMGQKIFLETHVKVKKDWTKNPVMMKELGYVTAD
ncbi:MAG: GTPase Era [Bdellovibrionales bacterium]